jgi:hypothetical protein
MDETKIDRKSRQMQTAKYSHTPLQNRHILIVLYIACFSINIQLNVKICDIELEIFISPYVSKKDAILYSAIHNRWLRQHCKFSVDVQPNRLLMI